MVKAFLLRKLRSIEAPPRPTAAGLRQYYTQIQAVCRQLTDAGVNIDEASIRTDIHDRMNYDMISEAAKQRRLAKTEEWKLEQLLGFIKEYMLTAEEIAVSHAVKRMPTESRNPYEHRRGHTVHGETTDIFDADLTPPELSDKDDKVKTERAQTPPPVEQPAPSPTTPNVVLNFYGDPSKGVQGKRFGPPQMGKRFNSNSNAANRPALPCIFCDSPQHRSHACDKYTTWLTRKKRLQTRPKPVCIRDKKADKTVHVLGREDDAKAESSDEASSACYSDVDEEYDYGSRPPTDMEDSDEECYTNVAHKLAVAEVSNVIDETKRKPCRIFFDSGSSDTLITKDQARELYLPILSRSTTTFHHFGGSPEGRTEETWRVQFRVFFSDGSQEVL
ncbi:hypothetical protein AAVH_34837 [Aphelenchoides avenae]|nr:hypothetical protein AAVH_34837 [Aphelenchus avenae]